jgi:hypothetical protein
MFCSLSRSEMPKRCKLKIIVPYFQFLGRTNDTYGKFLVQKVFFSQEFWQIEKEDKFCLNLIGLCMSSIGTRKIHLNQNLLILNFLDPDTVIMGQFLGLERERMCQFLGTETYIMR